VCSGRWSVVSCQWSVVRTSRGNGWVPVSGQWSVVRTACCNGWAPEKSEPPVIMGGWPFRNPQSAIRRLPCNTGQLSWPESKIPEVVPRGTVNGTDNHLFMQQLPPFVPFFINCVTCFTQPPRIKGRRSNLNHPRSTIHDQRSMRINHQRSSEQRSLAVCLLTFALFSLPTPPVLYHLGTTKSR
jgi:hypothetical protein